MLKKVSIEKVKYCTDCQEKYKLKQRTIFGGDGVKIKCDVCENVVERVSYITIKDIFELLLRG